MHEEESEAHLDFNVSVQDFLVTGLPIYTHEVDESLNMDFDVVVSDFYTED